MTWEINRKKGHPRRIISYYQSKLNTYSNAIVSGETGLSSSSMGVPGAAQTSIFILSIIIIKIIFLKSSL